MRSNSGSVSRTGRPLSHRKTHVSRSHTCQIAVMFELPESGLQGPCRTTVGSPYVRAAKRYCVGRVGHYDASTSTGSCAEAEPKVWAAACVWMLRRTARNASA
jgi:hypothetical protein